MFSFAGHVSKPSPLDPNFHYLIVLGTLPAPPSARYDSDSVEAAVNATTDVARLPAILRIERTAFSATFTDHLSHGLGEIVASTKRMEHTDIVRRSPGSRACEYTFWGDYLTFVQYSWLQGWLVHKEDVPDVKIRVIFPATEVHIQKVLRFTWQLVSG